MELSPSLAASNSVVRASGGSEAQMGDLPVGFVAGDGVILAGGKLNIFGIFTPNVWGFMIQFWWWHIFSNGLVSFLQKFYRDKLQLSVSLGLMISMGNFAFGAVGLGLKFFFAENGRGFLKDGSLEKVVGWYDCAKMGPLVCLFLVPWVWVSKEKKSIKKRFLLRKNKASPQQNHLKKTWKSRRSSEPTQTTSIFWGFSPVTWLAGNPPGWFPVYIDSKAGIFQPAMLVYHLRYPSLYLTNLHNTPEV